MRIEKIYFNTEDQVELFGLLHTTESSDEKSVIISVHGMGSNCEKKRDDIIAKKAVENKISYFTFDNRGKGLINSVHTLNKGKILQGTVFEDVEDSYYDILAAINEMTKKGYEKIYLQGHSLGSTKIVYTYNKLIDNNKTDILQKIQSISLLSLVDLVNVMQFLIKTASIDVVKIAIEKEKNGELDYIIDCKSSFLPVVSVKTFLRYYRDNSNIDFAKYTEKNYDFDKLNNIKVPIFMRWGNVNELISFTADEISKIMNEKIKNTNKNIGYIDGATHNYSGKEEILAEEILKFIKSI